MLHVCWLFCFQLFSSVTERLLCWVMFRWLTWALTNIAFIYTMKLCPISFVVFGWMRAESIATSIMMAFFTCIIMALNYILMLPIKQPPNANSTPDDNSRPSMYFIGIEKLLVKSKYFLTLEKEILWIKWLLLKQ